MTSIWNVFRSVFAPIVSSSLACFALFVAQAAYAHAPEQSYVFITVAGDDLSGRIEIHVPDLNRILDVELAEDGSVVRSDVEPYAAELRNYLLDRVALRPEGAATASLPLTNFELTTDQASQYLHYHFDFGQLSQEPDFVDVDYAVLFDENSAHRGLVVIETNWQTGTFENEAQVSLTFSGDDETQRLDLSDSSVWRGFAAMIELGMHHIWIGIDHILFLLALLLPSAVRREDDRWTPVAGFRPALIYVIKIVTIFTIAHTITLSLAALDIVTLPSRLVESIIALSIAIAAADIIVPIFRGRIWIVVFVFGLFHGFGFASVLGEIGVPPKYLVYSLLGFNIGVEIGQVAIVCLIFPLLYLLRRWWVYPQLVLRYGSIMLIAVSLYWFIERGFGVDLPAGAVLNSAIDMFV